MSDRCYVTVTCRPRDRKAVEDVFGAAETDCEYGGLLRLAFSEVAYAGVSEFQELSAAGVRCLGAWEAGDEYGPGQCVVEPARVRGGRAYRGVSEVGCDAGGDVSVAVTEAGVDRAGLRKAMAFMRRRARVRAWMEARL